MDSFHELHIRQYAEDEIERWIEHNGCEKIEEDFIDGIPLVTWNCDVGVIENAIGLEDLSEDERYNQQGIYFIEAVHEAYNDYEYGTQYESYLAFVDEQT